MKLIQRNVLRHVGDEAVFGAFLADEALPEFVGRAENEVERSGMSEPGVALHFFLELAGTPAGVTGEGTDFFGGGKGFTEVNERVEGMAEFEVGHDAGIRQEIVRMQKAEGGKLDGTAKEKRLVLELFREVGDDHFAQLVAAGTVQDEAESAFGVMLADEENGALEERTGQLPAVQQQLAFQIFRNL
jgi:hypothetical protein